MEVLHRTFSAPAINSLQVIFTCREIWWTTHQISLWACFACAPVIYYMWELIFLISMFGDVCVQRSKAPKKRSVDEDGDQRITTKIIKTQYRLNLFIFKLHRQFESHMQNTNSQTRFAHLSDFWYISSARVQSKPPVFRARFSRLVSRQSRLAHRSLSNAGGVLSACWYWWVPNSYLYSSSLISK